MLWGNCVWHSQDIITKTLVNILIHVICVPAFNIYLFKDVPQELVAMAERFEAWKAKKDEQSGRQTGRGRGGRGRGGGVGGRGWGGGSGGRRFEDNNI